MFNRFLMSLKKGPDFETWIRIMAENHGPVDTNYFVKIEIDFAKSGEILFEGDGSEATTLKFIPKARMILYESNGLEMGRSEISFPECLEEINHIHAVPPLISKHIKNLVDKANMPL